jgi:hypothetical protein
MKIGRMLAVPAFGVVLAASGFGFLASNNVSTSYAGQGQGTIAGYNVSHVTYTSEDGVELGLSGDNGSTYIESVSFDLDNPATPANVRAVINEPGHNYTYNWCVSTDGAANTAFTCTEDLTKPNADNSSAPAPIISSAYDQPDITDGLTVIAAS